MYALRSQALPPWDDPIREKFGFDGSGNSYGLFVRRVKDEIEELLADAGKHGVSFNELPAVIGRREPTLPKIVDKYFWVTITRGFSVPEISELQTWARWWA